MGGTREIKQRCAWMSKRKPHLWLAGPLLIRPGTPTDCGEKQEFLIALL